MNIHEHFLAILSEECSEVIKSVAKVHRFGALETEPGKDENNIKRVVREFNDLCAAMEDVADSFCINNKELYSPLAKSEKKEKVKRYMKYSISLGTLKDN